MREWILGAAVLLVTSGEYALAQPKVIPPPPDFGKLIGPGKFYPAKLREAIVLPTSEVDLALGFKIESSESEDKLPSVAAIERKLVGDERDAEWLLKLGLALTQAKSDRAKEAYTKSAAAFRKRIEKEPKVARHYLDLTRPLSELGQSDQVIASAKKSLELDEKNPDGWAVLRDASLTEIRTRVFGDTKAVSWKVSMGKTLPDVVPPLTDVQRESVRGLLKQVQYCQQQWSRRVPNDLENLARSVAFDAEWEIYDAYVRSGTWKGASAFQLLLSKNMIEALIDLGDQGSNPDAYHVAATFQMMAFLVAAKDPDWSLAKLTAPQKQAMARIIQPLEKLAGNDKKPIAAKACFSLSFIAMRMDETKKAKQFAAKSLALAPRDRGIIYWMVLVQTAKDPDADELVQFWLGHVRKHPSTHVWHQLAYLAGDVGDITHCVREAEKIDAKARNIQLMKAALALKRGPSGLADAGTILDALEKRLDEPDERDSLLRVAEHPNFQDAHRYLRAMHTALSGSWEKGRDQLIELRDKDVLVEPITKALQAFPRRPILLPLQKLDFPDAPKR